MSREATPEQFPVLRARFHQVILGAGYSEAAAALIMAEWLDKYLQDVPAFTAMLARYETGKGDDDK